MWQSDSDFLRDLDQMDEIGNSIIANDQQRSAFQAKQSGASSRNKKEKRSRLYSFSDEEEETPSKNISENLDLNNDLDNLAEVEHQIRKATGNVYSNEVLTSYWQKSVIPASKTESEELTDRGHSLMFEPKYNFPQPLASANNSPMKAKPKNGKRESVASALENKLKNLKAKTANKTELESRLKPKVEEFVLPKVEAPKSESRTRCRISLPIASNNFKDYRSGAIIAPPNLTKEYIPENPSPVSSWETWERYSSDSFDRDSSSSLSSYNTSTSYSNSSHSQKIDVSSEIEFPPL